RMPAAWLSGVDRETRETLSGMDQAVEFLMMGLRLTDGIDTSRYERLAGKALPTSRVADLQGMDLLEAIGEKITVTNQGFSLLNGVLRTLLED
ncbi:MAG: coproporphyrinogen III oxidase, partial [Pseudomonadota bacterium]